MAHDNMDKILICRYRFYLGILLLALLPVNGCIKGQSAPTEFYVLNSMTTPGDQLERTAAHPEMALGVGPIEIPEYLDRPQIVLRKNPSEVKLSEFEHWGEPLKSGVPRVLADDLSLELGTDRIVLAPWKKPMPLDYQVSIKVTRFDGGLGGSVVLAARWVLLSGKQRKVLQWKKSLIDQAVTRNDYGALVSAHSQALSRLAREIADSILDAEK